MNYFSLEHVVLKRLLDIRLLTIVDAWLNSHVPTMDGPK